MQDLSIAELRSIVKNRGIKKIKKYSILDKDDLLKNILLSPLSLD